MAVREDLLRALIENMVIVLVLRDLNTVPRFDLEAWLGEEWIETQSRRWHADVRQVLIDASPRLLEELGRAALRMLAPDAKELPLTRGTDGPHLLLVRPGR